MAQPKQTEIIPTAVYSDTQVAEILGWPSALALQNRRSTNKPIPKSFKMGRYRRTTGQAILNFIHKADMAGIAE